MLELGICSRIVLKLFGWVEANTNNVWKNLQITTLSIKGHLEESQTNFILEVKLTS